jgi:hypothetical protein
MNLSVGRLKKAKPENLLRLARFLSLRTDGMSHRQVAKLVRWRITRPSHRFADPAKRQDYASMWENL